MPKKSKVTRHSSSWFQIRSTLRRITMQTKDGVIFCLTHGSSKKTYKFLAGIVCLVRRSFYENELFPIVMTHRLSKKKIVTYLALSGVGRRACCEKLESSQGMMWVAAATVGSRGGISLRPL